MDARERGHAPPAAAVLRLAEDATASAVAFGDDVWRRVMEALPEATSWERSLVEAGSPATQAIVRELATALAAGDEAEMRAAPLGLAHARQFARDGVPLTVVLRIYQLGHEIWRDYYIRVLERETETREELVQAAGAVSAATFAFLRVATDEVVTAYEDERVRGRDSGEWARRRTLDALLAGNPVDVDQAATRLGIDLRRAHTALVAWIAPPAEGEDPAPALEALLRDAARAVGVERPLVLMLGWTTAFAWLTRSPQPGDPPLDELLAAVALDPGPAALTCGRESFGAVGFRATHEEAQAARAFVEPGSERIVAYADVELASLLAAEPARAHAFVRRELGGLAADDVPTRRLRETLTAYLATSSSATRTAERLGIHKNTVIYRVRQAEESRGTPLGRRRLELEAALRLLDAQPALLSP